ncbi:MAG: hypothetical protein H7066_21810, partial [Cytophagaceae bacterium]|nr:hypothetical protein [Gemmatimonadaceae bacterium]
PLLVGTGVLAIGAVAWFAMQQGGATASPGGAAAPAAAESSVVVPAAPVASATSATRGGSTPRTEVVRDSQGNAAPPVVSTPAQDVAAVSSVTSTAAKRELDSLTTFLEADDTGEAEARQAIPTLQRVLGKLGTASDSTWGYLALVTAHGMAGEDLRACTALHSADRLATTARQREAIRTMYASEALKCVPR